MYANSHTRTYFLFKAFQCTYCHVIHKVVNSELLCYIIGCMVN